MTENLKKLAKAAESDEKLARALIALNNQKEKQNFEELTALAQNYGIVLNPEDFQEADNLSLDELDEVAGGFKIQYHVHV